MKKVGFAVFLLLTGTLVAITTIALYQAPKYSVTYVDVDGEVLFQEITEAGYMVPIVYEQLPEYLVDFLVATEDARFYQHVGVDVFGVLRALRSNIESGAVVSGGSTLTQQLAFRRVFPNHRGPKHIFHKMAEGVAAIGLDALWSKEQILIEYLNTMFFGNFAYGVEVAARTYFGVPVSTIDRAQAATLVALLQQPSTLSLPESTNALNVRRRFVLEQARENGYIAEDAFDAAVSEDITLDTRAFSYLGCLQSMLTAEFEPVAQELAIDSSKQTIVHTTLHHDLHFGTERILQNQLLALPEDYMVGGAAAVALDAHSGTVLAYVCNVSRQQDSVGEVDFIQSLRQPGSALKPIIYHVALEQGHTMGHWIDDSLHTFYTKKEQAYVPENYDQQERGIVTYADALGSSLNIPAVVLLRDVGIAAFVAKAESLGITTFPHPDDVDLSAALGGEEVHLIELTNAYAGIANGGEYNKWTVIEKITVEGETVYAREPSIAQTISPEGYILSDVLSRNDFRRFSFGEVNPLITTSTAAVKTGTSQEFRDSWTVGYNNDVAIGVWVGNANHEPMQGISGVTGAAPMWKESMELFIEHGYDTWFERPAGLEEQLVCSNPACSANRNILFVSGTQTNHNSFSSTSVTTFGITYPYKNQVIRIDPDHDLAEYQFMYFAASSDYPIVTWSLDGITLDMQDNVIQRDGEWRLAWYPMVGEHEIKIINSQNQSDVVQFKVVAQ